MSLRAHRPDPCAALNNRGILVAKRDNMKRAFAAVVVGLLFLSSGGALAALGDKSPETLEQEYRQEKNPRKRANLAMELLEQRLRQLRSFLDSGTMLEEPSPLLDNYLAALERLETSVREASHAGTAKSTEMRLRRHMRELENFKMNVSAMERPPLEKVIARLVAVREQALYSIMHPRKEPEKK